MSSLTRCNYCSLREMRIRAARKNSRVDLYTEKDEFDQIWTVAVDQRRPEEKHSFLALTDHCVCNE